MGTLEIRDLTFTYPLAERPALRGVSLSLEPGSFTLLCGPSGCGKTTLLRHLKTVLTPHGKRSGAVLLDGETLSAVSEREQAARIGFVLQQPEDQIVTDKVWHELAFGLENLGVEPETLRLRVGEMASFFGIQNWFDQSTDTLSGGQKQLLNLAAVMAMQPEVLILDEPTAQLDPIAAGEFLRAVQRLNRELGVTVLLSEHRLEQALPMADTVIVMSDGAVRAAGSAEEISRVLADDPFFLAFPAPIRLWAALGFPGACPMDVRGGRALLRAHPPKAAAAPLPPEESAGECAVSLREVWFRYDRAGSDVLRGLSLEARRGELFAVVGGNGSGKSTVLSLLSGALKPYRGKVQTQGRRVLALPQDPRTLFWQSTVLDALRDSGAGDAAAAEMAERLELTAVLNRDPLDLSGGEQQRAALAMLLLRQPEALLLDEPTKGMDAAFRAAFGELLRRLCAEGLTVILVSHDIPFCARYAHRAGLLFDGQLLSEGSARGFFTGNHFYTTDTNRMARPWLPGALLPEEVIGACSQNSPSV